MLLFYKSFKSLSHIKQFFSKLNENIFLDEIFFGPKMLFTVNIFCNINLA